MRREKSIISWRGRLWRNNPHTHLLSEEIEYGDIPPPFHILSLVLAYHFVLWFLWILLFTTRKLLEQRADLFFQEDEIAFPGEILDFDVGESGVDTEGEVGRESPWGRCPCQEGRLGFIDEWEGDDDWEKERER